MNNYEKQAEDFLTKTKTKFNHRYLGHFKYFDDDKQERDVYEIILSREGKEIFAFRFGQSIANSGEPYKRNPQGKTVRKRITPTPYDVLACLIKHDVETFEDFCAEYGYNTDSRKAEKIYFNVQREYKNVQRVFGDVLDELREIN